MLPKLQKEFGACWVVMADSTLQKTFRDFSSAADFALQKFADKQVLIRHTHEALLTAPFVHIEG
jgi:hypothetical protein